MLPVDSHASVRWDKKFFSGFGASFGYESIKHTDQLISAIYDTPATYDGATLTLTGRAGRTLSENLAVYLPISFTFTSIDYVGIGMMLRLGRNSPLFLFGDVGAVFIGGPAAASAGFGLDISHFSLDVSARVARGGNGETNAGYLTLSYLW